MDSLIDILVDQGHSVDIIVARMNSQVKSNCSNRADRKFIYGFPADSPWSKTPHLIDPFQPIPRDYTKQHHFINIATNLCEIGLSSQELHRFMTSKRYDIALGTGYDYCAFSIFHHYNISAIASYSSIGLVDDQCINSGLPNPASVTHTILSAEDLSTFSGRVWNLLNWIHANYITHPQYLSAQQRVIDKYLNSSIDVLKVVHNIDMIFVNSHEIIERPRPISHKIKYIGGINSKPLRPLPANIQNILSSIDSEGIILFCFGTQVPSSVFSRQLRKSFVDAFRHFSKYTILWKYDRQPGDDEIFHNVTNIYTIDWLPQADILNHPRTKLFISHAGLNSYMEASNAGVPILAIPLFLDQPHNAYSGESIGTTLILSKMNLTTEAIISSLHTILTDSSFTNNAKRISKMLSTFPYSPKSSFIHWINYMATNPGLHQNYNQPGLGVSPFYYYSLDILSFFLLFLFLLIWIFKFLIENLTKIIKNQIISRISTDSTLFSKQKVQ